MTRFNDDDVQSHLLSTFFSMYIMNIQVNRRVDVEDDEFSPYFVLCCSVALTSSYLVLS